MVNFYLDDKNSTQNEFTTGSFGVAKLIKLVKHQWNGKKNPFEFQTSNRINDLII